MTMIHKTSLKQHLTALFSLNTVVLLSLSSAGLTVKAAFQLLSSHPCVQEYLDLVPFHNHNKHKALRLV